MGRKMIPTHLKVLQGTARKGRLNRDEPKAPPLSDLEPPDYLGEIGAAEWNRRAAQLKAMGVLSEVDDTALAAYCRAYERWVEAEDLLRKAGEPTLTTSGGNVIQHPLVGIANRAMELMIRIAAEFGMTPSSRGKVKTHIIPGADPMDEFLKRR